VVELWDLFARLGLPRPKRFVDYYKKLGPAELVRLAEWDQKENEGRIFRPWRPFHHPQLGDVEVGGLDPRIGIWNPPLPELATVCTGQSRAFLRVAALAPAVRIEASVVTPVGDGLSQVTLTVVNHGYLPTTILSSAKGLDFNEPVSVDCEADGVELVEPGQRHVVVGHLEGWGRGLESSQSAVHYPRSSGSGHRARIQYLVRGHVALRFSMGSCRVGWVTTSLRV
jgi:hypothetical protein